MRRDPYSENVLKIQLPQYTLYTATREQRVEVGSIRSLPF